MTGRFVKKWDEDAVTASLEAIVTTDAPKYAAVLKPPLVPYATLYERAATDPAFERRLAAAVAVRKARFAAARVAGQLSHLDAIICLVASGMTVRAACKTDRAYPSFGTVYTLLKTDADRSARLHEALRLRDEAASAARPPIVQDEAIQKIAQHVESGSSLGEALTVAGVNKTALYKHYRRDATSRSVVLGAIDRRESGDHATGRAARYDPRRVWTDAEFEAALAAISAYAGKSVKDVLQAPLMTYPVIYGKAQRDPGFLLRLNDAIGGYIKRRKLARPKVVKRVYEQNVLRSGLLLDQIYADASKLFHRGLDDDLRDDMISEVVMAVLDGRLPRDEVAKNGREFGWAFVRGLKRQAIDSLDRTVGFDGDKRSLGDLMTSDQWSFEDAA